MELGLLDDDSLVLIVGACELRDLNPLSRSCRRFRQATSRRLAAISMLTVHPASLYNDTRCTFVLNRSNFCSRVGAPVGRTIGLAECDACVSETRVQARSDVVVVSRLGRHATSREARSPAAVSIATSRGAGPAPIAVFLVACMVRGADRAA